MSDPVTHLNTALEGRYRIERELGEGGMANVYLAHDERHDRKVALKVLKPELAAAIGADRFLAEIKTTASLQHPHILTLHDSGEADGYLFYVMPHIEGESLRSRLEREGQLPVDVAVEMAMRIAEALAYAHRHGVVHRDIKPANILLTEAGPIVADFGIALAAHDVGNHRLTETGISLGSPNYMSPEQAAGDGRIGPASDVFALGCVLFEMLAGAPPFVGNTTQATVLKILADDPESVSQQRKSVPPNVNAAVSHALEKIPADRFISAEAFANALADPSFRSPTASAIIPPRPSRRWTTAVVAMVVALIGMAFLAGRVLSDRPGPVLRLSLDLPQGQALVGDAGARLAIAPNGLRFAYVGELEGGASGSRLWIRDLHRLQATDLAGTEGAFSPTFSPDGQRIAFLRDRSVWTVDLDGSAPIMVADEVSTGTYRIDWGPDGFIYFGGRGVFRVASRGGEVEQVVPQDEDGRLHLGLRVLPNGRGAVFALGQNETRSENVITAADFETKELKILTPGVAAAYSHTGHLLVVRADGQLDAIPFDQSRLELSSQETTVAGGIGIGSFGAVDLAISEAGTLLYTTGAQEPRRRIVFVDEAGFEKPMEAGWTGSWESVVLSPDEERLLVGTGFGATPQLWIRTLDGGQMTRLTLEGDLNRRPVWSDDGQTVLFISHRGEYRAVYQKRADGVGHAQVFLELQEHIDEADWSPRGDWLVYRTGMTGGEGRDIHAWHLGGDSTHVPIAANPTFDEMSPSLSPDGQWLAYLSTASGEGQLYVRSFPEADRFQTQISVDRGQAPVWSDDGSTLFYVEGQSPELRMTAVSVSTGSTFSVVERRELFSLSPYFVTFAASAFDYRDADNTFVLIRRDESEGQGDLVLVQNFSSSLSLDGSE